MSKIGDTLKTTAGISLAAAFMGAATMGIALVHPIFFLAGLVVSAAIMSSIISDESYAEGPAKGALYSISSCASWLAGVLLVSALFLSPSDPDENVSAAFSSTPVDDQSIIAEYQPVQNLPVNIIS